MTDPVITVARRDPIRFNQEVAFDFNGQIHSLQEEFFSIYSGEDVEVVDIDFKAYRAGEILNTQTSFINSNSVFLVERQALTNKYTITSTINVQVAGLEELDRIRIDILFEDPSVALEADMDPSLT